MTSIEMVDKFVSWARCTRELAESYLQRHNWNYEKATDDYWRTNILIY